ncbi:sensor histidine kinase [Leifsonia flava]|uniref:Sensor histidine kinase n=2 Tax=Orlajensenia leifsoniae TaxID=2561933 RepID=A0A4Y9R4C2_9MICO|nr:sensor histidine kinase [Leifsonia flava]
MAPTTMGSVSGILRSRGAVSWYVGAVFSGLWLVGVGFSIAQYTESALSLALGILALFVYWVGFAIAAPLQWVLPVGHRLVVGLALFALSFTLWPWLGLGVHSIWTYVGVIVGMGVLRWRTTWGIILGLGLLAGIFGYLQLGWDTDVLISPAIIISISMMMASFARVMAAMNQLRAAQREMEIMAAGKERDRVARDIHDILGHSLTVITVKAELAGRLLDVDVERARTEIGEVEALARGALADVRTTVAGFRGVSVTAELAAARSALASAGIRSEFPSSTDAVRPEHRELAGWVVREGVTNVIRHSGASVCRVRLEPGLIDIADDGGGVPPTEAPSSSTGLNGLRERVEAAGLRLTTGRSDLGGFELRVSA